MLFTLFYLLSEKKEKGTTHISISKELFTLIVHTHTKEDHLRDMG